GEENDDNDNDDDNNKEQRQQQQQQQQQYYAHFDRQSLMQDIDGDMCMQDTINADTIATANATTTTAVAMAGNETALAKQSKGQRECKEELQMLLEKERQEHSDEKVMFEQTVEQLRGQMDVLHQEKEAWNNRYHELESAKAELQSRLQLEMIKFEKEKENLSKGFEQQLLQVQNGAVQAIDSTTEENMKLKLHIAQLKGHNEALELELQKAFELIKSKDNQLTDLQGQLTLFQQRVGDTNAHLRTAQDALQLAHADNAKLAQQLIEYKDHRTQATRDLDAARLEATDLQTQMAKLKETLTHKNTKLERLENQVDQLDNDFNKLKLNFDSLTDDHQILTDAYETLKDENSQTTKALEESKNEIQIKEKEESIEENKDSIKELTSQLSDTVSNSDEAMNKLLHKNEEVINKHINLESTKSEWTKMGEECKSNEHKLSALESAKKATEQSLRDFQSVYETLESKHQEQCRIYEQCLQELEDYKSRCDEYNHEIVSYNVKVSQLTHENQSLHERAKEFEKEAKHQIQNLGKNLVQLEQESATLKHESQKMQAAHEQAMLHNQTLLQAKEVEITELKQSSEKALQDITNQKRDQQSLFKQQIDTIQQAHAQKIEQLNATLAQQSNQFTQEQTKWTSEKEELAQRCVTLEKELEDSKGQTSEKSKLLELYHKNLSEFQKAVLNVPMSPNKMMEGQREAFENEQKNQLERQIISVFKNAESQFETNERLHREALQMMQKQTGKLEAELSAQKELYATCSTQLQDMTVRYGELTEEFEKKKQQFNRKMDEAHEQVKASKDRRDRLIEAYEERLRILKEELEEHKKKKDMLTQELVSQKEIFKTNTNELAEHKNELKNNKETIGNLQKLVKSLKTEKESVEKKLDQSQTQWLGVQQIQSKMESDLTKSIQERMDAIKTSKQMRISEEKVYKEMMEWKCKYNELKEITFRNDSNVNELKAKISELEAENVRLAGHHNAQQRINHLLDLKKEINQLKQTNRLLINKLNKYER
ncbi:putative vesicular transport factor Uso1p, partial [Reticulomyxa filosa]